MSAQTSERPWPNAFFVGRYRSAVKSFDAVAIVALAVARFKQKRGALS